MTVTPRARLRYTKERENQWPHPPVNAVEIEEAITQLAAAPFDATEFPFAFLRAFGNKETTLTRLRAGASNRSDLGGVLQTNNIHIVVSPVGEVAATLAALKAGPATARAKARFVLATDGDTFRAVYTVRFAGLFHVLHTFKKKSKSGVATPRHEIKLIEQRLKRAKED